MTSSCDGSRGGLPITRIIRDKPDLPKPFFAHKIPYVEMENMKPPKSYTSGLIMPKTSIGVPYTI